jgi:hypothetical protein
VPVVVRPRAHYQQFSQTIHTAASVHAGAVGRQDNAIVDLDGDDMVMAELLSSIAA